MADSRRDDGAPLDLVAGHHMSVVLNFGHKLINRIEDVIHAPVGRSYVSKHPSRRALQVHG
jgi:hypothetical protein